MRTFVVRFRTTIFTKNLRKCPWCYRMVLETGPQWSNKKKKFIEGSYLLLRWSSEVLQKFISPSHWTSRGRHLFDRTWFGCAAGIMERILCIIHFWRSKITCKIMIEMEIFNQQLLQRRNPLGSFPSAVYMPWLSSPDLCLVCNAPMKIACCNRLQGTCEAHLNRQMLPWWQQPKTSVRRQFYGVHQVRCQKKIVHHRRGRHTYDV